MVWLMKRCREKGLVASRFYQAGHTAADSVLAYRRRFVIKLPET
jgi:hypothetical protein